MKHDFFESSFPSAKRNLLDLLIGKKVENLIRYSWWSKEDSATECEIDKKDVFSLTTGPFCIEFESNISIGFNSDVTVSSIILWAETIDGKETEDLMKNDKELFPIEAGDQEYSENYFKNIVGQSLIKYEIIKIETMNSLQWDHPREVGLVLFFSDNSHIVLSHQLTNEVSDDFTVICWDQINKDSIYPLLYKTSEFWA